MAIYSKTSLKRLLKPLVTAFALTASSLPALANDAEKTPQSPVSQKSEQSADPRGLWKVNKFDIVIAIRDCPEKEHCTSIHWIAADERDVYSYFGPDKQTRRAKNITTPTYEDVQELCASEIDFVLSKDTSSPNKRKGRVHLTGRNMWANMSLELTDADTAKVVISKFIFKETDTWTRIPKEQEAKYPACKPHHHTAP